MLVGGVVQGVGIWDLEYRWCFVEIVEAVVALGLIIVRTLATAIAMIR